MKRTSCCILTTALWLVALALGAALDGPWARWAHETGFDQTIRNSPISHVIKFGGRFEFALVLAALLLLIRQIDWRGAGFLLLCSIWSGVNFLLKWVVGRIRPYKGPADWPQPAPFHFLPFRGGLAGLFNGQDLCFPSGHACAAFALAAGLAILKPRWRWACYAGAALVALERFGENAHYMSDTIGAAAIAIGGVHVLHCIIQRCTDSRNKAQNIGLRIA